jgi:hypothetical protein
MRALLAVALAATLVLAGCSAPTNPGPGPANATAPTATTPPAVEEVSVPTATPTETTSVPTVTPPETDYTDPANVAVDLNNADEDGLPFDQNRTWARVVEILDVNVAPPNRLLYLPNSDRYAGTTSGIGGVTLYSENESVLAHEFAHSALLRLTPDHPTGSPDEVFARDAVVEGSAQYVESVYDRRYDTGSAEIADLPEDPAVAYALAPYHYGLDYLRSQVDDGSEVLAVHRYPPSTSEAILHGLSPATEPPTPLFVTAADRHLAPDAVWRSAGTRRLGELAVRLTLRTRLPEERAAAAAAGWGNDAVLTMERGDRTGFAWVVRWDDRANATEFAEAGRAFAEADPPTLRPGSAREFSATPYRPLTDRLWGPTDADVTVRRVDQRTVALVVGPEAFLDATTVDSEGLTVTVSVGE